MRACMFSIIICIFLIPCYGNAGMSKSNFFDLEYTEEIEKLEYVSSGGIETMEIYFKNNRGYVYPYNDKYIKLCLSNFRFLWDK